MDEFDRMGGGGGRVTDGTGLVASLVKWLVVLVWQKFMVSVPWFSKRCLFTTGYGAGNRRPWYDETSKAAKELEEGSQTETATSELIVQNNVK